MAMMTEMKTQGMSARRILGKDVLGTGRDKIGEVDDLILGSTGCTMFAIVDEGGFLGMAERHHVVPWEALSMTADERLMVPFDREKLRGAPVFDRSNMPDWGNEAWQRTVYDYYGMKYTGMMGGSMTGGTMGGQGMGGGGSMGGGSMGGGSMGGGTSGGSMGGPTGGSGGTMGGGM